MNVLSLFDGMSCGRIALERAGIKIDKYYSSEIKPHAITCTQHNYPDTIQLGDVTKWKNWTIDFSSIDMVIGGSPCQDFSQANKDKKGLEGDKSRLFFIYRDIVNFINPKYFLLENVAMETNSYAYITNQLNVQPIAINSDLVSAQSRPRLYWTNIYTRLDLLGMMFVDIPQPKDKKIKLQSILASGYVINKKARTLLESDSRPLVTPLKIFHRWYSSGFTNIVFNDKQHYLNCKADYDKNYKGMSAEQIDKTNYDRNIYKGVRYLTQIESERCQTVPEGYTSCLSVNEAKSLLGDGWTVDVLAHIFAYINS